MESIVNEETGDSCTACHLITVCHYGMACARTIAQQRYVILTYPLLQLLLLYHVNCVSIHF